MRNNKGFTLAEILVTLGIIGVIASMTIPNLVQDIQDAQLKTAWKKAYAELDQATKRIMQDNGGNLKGVFSNHISVKDKYLPYLSYVKSCDISSSQGCLYSSYKDLNGLPNIWGCNLPGIVLGNGNLVIFKFYSQSCSYLRNTVPVCAVAQIDVNGFKNPNINGKDIFSLWITADSTKPLGVVGDDFNPNIKCINGNTDITNSGEGCSAKYLYQ